MGSYSTMVDESTTKVAIEAASFNAASIRRTSRRLQLISDSSNRFVKGTDINRTDLALDLATKLLVEHCDAKVVEETVTYDVLNHEEREAILSLTKINSLLGTQFSLSEVSEVFKALNFEFELVDYTYKVKIPSYRNDIAIDHDLIEEVIRLKGFEHLPLTVPACDTLGMLSQTQSKRRIIRSHLCANGINEAMTYTLVDEDKVNDFNIINKFDEIKIMHPMSDERSYLRRSLIPSLLNAVNYNLSRNIYDVNLFEISNLYGVNKECEHLGIALTGALNNVPLYKVGKSDFYTIKGLVESILSMLGIVQPRFQYTRVEKENSYYHPGKSVYLMIGKQKIGVMGLIHPLMSKKYGVKDVFVAELDLRTILETKTSATKFTPLVQYP